MFSRKDYALLRIDLVCGPKMLVCVRGGGLPYARFFLGDLSTNDQLSLALVTVKSYISVETSLNEQ